MKQIFFILTAMLPLVEAVYSQGFTQTWRKPFGVPIYSTASGILTTGDQGSFVFGRSKRSQFGDHHGTEDWHDAYVTRLDSSGNLKWGKSLGGTKHDLFHSVTHGTNGSFVCLGLTQSDDGDVTGFRGGVSDIWVVCLSSTGAVLWKKCIGGSSYDDGARIRQTPDGGFIISGYTESNDGDFSGKPTGYYGYVLKLSSTGQIVWKYFLRDQAVDVLPLADGNYVATWSEYRQICSPGNYPKVTFCEKFTPLGARLWLYQKPTDCSNLVGTYIEPAGLELFPNGDIALVTSYQLQNDKTAVTRINSNTGTASPINDVIIGSRGSYDFAAGQFLIQDDRTIIWGIEGLNKIVNGFSAGFEYVYPLSPITNTRSSYVDIIRPGEYLLVIGGDCCHDVIRVKEASFNTLKGLAFLDLNYNGQRDNNEPAFSKGWIEIIKPGAGIVLRQLPAGEYTAIVDTGSFVTSVHPTRPYYSVTPVQKNTNFGNNYNRSDTTLFAVTALPGSRDNGVTARPQGPARAGFSVLYYATIRNNAIDTMVNKPFKMIKDGRLGIISAIPAPSSINGDTLIWNIAQLLPEDKLEFQLQLQVPPIPTVTLGDTLVSTFSVDTTGDIFKPDNTSTIRQRVTGSYDPNDKFENHGGTVERQALLNGEELLYTIRFQNTGTDTAFKVVIRDTLDTKLDPASMTMEKASHSYQLQQQYGNIAIWTFNNILLPDSNVNEPASNGYLSFRIRAKNTVADGDTLKNRSAIYFDFNPPIITNMVTTVVGSKLPVPLVANIANLYCNLQGQQTGKLTNPPANTTISVLLDGQPLVYTPADSLFRFDVSSLAEGNHEIKAKYTNNNGSDSAMKPFTVNRFVQAVINTPDQAVCKLSGAINLQANTNVSWSGTGVSGSSFNPAVAGVGVHRIVATKTNGTCPDSKDTLTITVDDFVQAVISTPDQTVCRLSGILSLQANTNVNWAGPGVSGSSFNPATAGVGVHRIIATKTNGTCPDLKDTLTITVDDFVQAVINTPDQTVCKLSGAINLQANTNVSWAGPGVSGSSFNPATAGVGVHRIVATKTNGTCPDSKDTLTITVDDFVQAVINTADQTVCKLSGAVNLQANTNVSWAGPGVGGSLFNPTAAGVGVHRIIATKTNGTCPDSKDTITITVDEFIKPVILNNDTTICVLAGGFNLRSNVPANWSGTGVSGSSFSPATAGPGNYLIIASKTNGVCPDGKDTLMITVRAAVTPVVNVTASATTLSNASSFSDITAVNTSGVGTAPLFTFAIDAGFTQVLQAESANSSLRVLPQMLNAGLNTIFVRMRTSSDCYTAATAVASVQLTLNVSTPSRTELDKALKVFPNPNNGRFGFRFETGINDVVRAVVLDMNGKQVYAENYGQVAQYNFGRELVIRRPQGEYVLVLYVGGEKISRKILLTQ